MRRLAAALIAGTLLAVPAAFAQSGGTTVPGPGDPCPATYPGDDAKKSSIARWMARGAAVRELPDELPVIAGLAESGLRNMRLPGNRYAGYFSMHLALNDGAYRGFPRRPERQLRWFTDSAVLVRQRAIAEGHEDFGVDPDGYGLWVADIERPAPENRAGYQRYLDDARDLLRSPCRPSGVATDEAPPALRVRAARHQRGAVTLRVRCPAEPCVAGASATPHRRVRRAPAIEVPDKGATLVLSPRTRRSVRLVVTVIAVDEAGNSMRAQRPVRLRP